MTGLEVLKELDEHCITWHDNPTKEKVEIIRKNLEALEIIKEKRVDVDTLIYTFAFGNRWQYNNEMHRQCGLYDCEPLELTQEEYDLLREVLCEKLQKL